MYLHVRSKEVAEKIKEAIPEAKVSQSNFVEIKGEKYRSLFECYSFSVGLRIYERETREDKIFIPKEDIYVVYEL